MRNVSLVAGLFWCQLVLCSCSSPEQGPPEIQFTTAQEAGAAGSEAGTAAKDSGPDALSCPALAPEGGPLFDAAAPSDEGCPLGPGPAMVRVGSFCIDATEVTNAHYATFIADVTPDGLITDLLPQACMSVEGPYALDLLPYDDSECSSATDPVSKPDYPVVCVDWCDAYAYCKWAGKRLCGQIGGGSVAFDDFDDASKSQWFAACSSDGANVFPYGDAFQPAVCNVPDCPERVLSVGAAPQCHGMVPPFDRIFDLAGNVWEWDDSCNAQSGAEDQCHTRGGGADRTMVDANGNYMPGTYMHCAQGAYSHRDNTVFSSIGFRCCADVPGGGR